jgi:hypothetical protein
MADESDDPELAMERLEAALERIARLAAQPHAPAGTAGGPSAAELHEVAAGLESLIGRLRAALGSKPD